MSVFLSAEWRYLAMLNYEVDPQILFPLVPSGTELDSWHNKFFISIVGFLFLKTRVLGLPILFHRNFEEVNLRFYVRRKVFDEWRRGVVFVKEIVPKWAIATVAKIAYNERYISLPMRHQIDEGEQTWVRYDWMWKKNWNSLRVKTKGNSMVPEEGSQEEFITEHFWGYTSQPDGGTVEYRVEHPKWEVWNVEDSSFECEVETLYGSAFVSVLQSSPSSAFLANGSAINVYSGARIDPFHEESRNLR